VKFPALRSNPKPAQKPHPPVHIGAGGERALRNTALIGDGWAPIALKPDDLKTELAKLRQLCAEVNRDFSNLEITIFSLVDGRDSRAAIEAYRAAGAHRLVLFPPRWRRTNTKRNWRSWLKAGSSDLCGGACYCSATLSDWRF
jgi:alkanesulfonate monooxygenase SsuD/methylene tetrahydromethanopterin reductase-like flavin-dependent oxidoreductase (luciferase family)